MNLKLPDTTLFDILQWLKSQCLIRIYERDKIIIYYPGVTQFLFRKFFSKYRRAYYNIKEYDKRIDQIGGLPFKSPRILYSSMLMNKFIYEHLRYELIIINQEIGIEELFERLVLDIGNWLLEEYSEYPKFRKHYRTLKKKKLQNLIFDLYRESHYDAYFGIVLLEELNPIDQALIMQLAFDMIKDGASFETIKPEIPFKFFSLFYVAALNKIDMKKVFRNFFAMEDYERHKHIIGRFF